MDGFFLNTDYAQFEKEKPFAFSLHSSIGCGGYAPVAFYPKTVEEFTLLITWLQQDKIPFSVVGNMTNILPPDGQLQKVIVCTKRFAYIKDMFFSAGITANGLLQTCKRMRKSGAEFLVGIPCTLGGALYMNAGVNGVYIAEIVDTVTAWYNGKISVLTNEECRYAYKHSVFMQDEFIILGATLKLADSDETTIESELAKYRARRLHLPKGKSMGCVFKNPEGISAGKLIEDAGLKGLQIGGAKISEQHANFIINDNNATSAQIRTLIGIVKRAVFAQYNIRLREEIQYL